MNPAVQMRGITKSFGGKPALKDVNISVQPGTIHAIIGENGAGKTTLMRILYGALSSDSGEVQTEGETRKFRSAEDGLRAGIGMVSQHYAIIPELTCLQNLMLGAEPAAWIDRAAAEKRATELADRMGFTFDWHQSAQTLSPGSAQKLEILKLLWRRAKIMILDEPTAMLSPADADALFASLRLLVAQGDTVILVSHRLPEVLEHCTTVTVLRGGELVAEKPVSETNAEELTRYIVGRDLTPRTISTTKPGHPILEIQTLTVKGDRGELALKSISLTARSGEIVGIAGVDGNGQRELFQAIAGLRPVATGRILLDGKPIADESTATRLQSGLRLIPDDRHAEAVIESWTLEENAALGLQRWSNLASANRVDIAARRTWAAKVAARFSTKHDSLTQSMSGLSGGNQQRFVAARALSSAPKLILAFQPARGLDLAGVSDVYRAIREECELGASAILMSFDLDELLANADRILVMNHGTLVEAESKDREAVGSLMVSGAS